MQDSIGGASCQSTWRKPGDIPAYGRNWLGGPYLKEIFFQVLFRQNFPAHFLSRSRRRERFV